MTDRIETDPHAADFAARPDGEIAALVWQIAGIGFALMLSGALLLWWHFGPVIFFDTLATLQSCF